MSPTAARLTPEGRGGVAVVRIRGFDRRLFSGRWPKPGEIAYGRIADLDDGLLVDFGDFVEVSVHGSPVIVEKLLSLFDPEPAEADLVVREARALLAKAPTLLAARVLADQAAGAWSRGAPSLETARFGIALAESPPVVALVGRPNVGKSTLFNALVRRDRAIVSPEPGTTRDPVRELVSFDGIPVRLVDTAGLGDPRDALDAEAQARTAREVERADLVIHVREAGEPARGFSVVNKSDLPGGGDVSALTGAGVDDLRARILAALGLSPRYEPGAPVVFTRRQKELLERGGNPF